MTRLLTVTFLVTLSHTRDNLPFWDIWGHERISVASVATRIILWRELEYTKPVKWLLPKPASLN
jgi:hypothetical protein